MTDRVIGEYNLFDDPIIGDMGITEKAAKAYQGETVYLQDIPLPLQTLIDKYGNGELSLETIFLNITSFPIYNDDHQQAYVGTILTTSKLYRGKDEIIKGQLYIEQNWQENFDLENAANASGLSKTQFQRLFKSYTGLTPHDYYVSIKIKMIQEKLLDLNLTISQVFTECGLDYNGHYAKLFKERVGVTPSEYRKNSV